MARPGGLIRAFVITLLVLVLLGAGVGLWWRWDPWTRVQALPNMTDAEIAPGGEFMIMRDYYGNKTEVYNLKERRTQATLGGHDRRIFSARFSPDGSTVATACEDKTVRLWDASTGKELRVLLQGEGGHREIAEFSPDGRFIVTGGEGGPAQLWRTADGAEIRTYGGGRGSTFAARFSPDGKRLAIAGGTERIGDLSWIADVDSGTELLRLCSPGEPYRITGLDFSDDGHRLLTHERTDGRDGLVRVRDSHTGRVLQELNGPVRITQSVFLPGSSMALTASSTCKGDGVVRLWDIAGERVVKEVRGQGVFWGIAVSPDGRRIATCSGSSTGEPASILWERRRPEPWWGVLWLPEPWIALTAAALLLIFAASPKPSPRPALAG